MANIRQRSYKHSQGIRASLSDGIFTSVHTHQSVNNVFTVNFAIKESQFQDFHVCTVKAESRVRRTQHLIIELKTQVKAEGNCPRI